MKLDKRSSERLSFLRFPLIAGIVFIHGYGTQVGFSTQKIGVLEPNWVSLLIRESVSHGLARVAVPLFFLMSGYLFFLGFDWSVQRYKRKLQSRVNTLLVPFLFWNLIMLLFLAIAQSLPMTQNYFSGKNMSINSFGVFDYFNALFGINKPPPQLINSGLSVT